MDPAEHACGCPRDACRCVVSRCSTTNNGEASRAASRSSHAAGERRNRAKAARKGVFLGRGLAWWGGRAARSPFVLGGRFIAGGSAERGKEREGKPKYNELMCTECFSLGSSRIYRACNCREDLLSFHGLCAALSQYC